MSKTPQSPRTRRARRIAGAAIATVASAAALQLGTAESAQAATGKTYYVSPSGSDSAAGTEPGQPLRTLGRIAGLNLQAGDQVLLERGASFTGKLELWRSGAPGSRITIGSYGSRTAPKPRITNNPGDFCVMVGASYVTVTDIFVHGCRVGIWTRGTDNLITAVEATDNMHGIEVDSGSQGVQVLDNYLHHNTRMAPDTPGEFDDYGAVGVVVLGDNTEVAYNEMTDNVGPSADFGTDGSAVEIYGGIGTVVHHNRAHNNRTFTELGHSRSADTTFAYNVSTSTLQDSEFLITRGAEDYFGPVRGTVAINNTVRMTGANSLGFSCYAGCTPATFASYNNIFDVAGSIGWVQGQMAGGNNIYWRGRVDFPLLPGDKMTNPQFRNSRMHLAPSSPAVDQVARPHMKRDFSGNKVGVDGNGDGRRAADIGAFEAGSKGKGHGKGKNGKGKDGKGKNNGGKNHGGKSNGAWAPGRRN